MTLTNQELLLLAILLQTERYGYEIDKIIRSGHLGLGSNIARSSIYAVLGRLHRKRLVDWREVVQSGRPSRKLFAISELGRVELQRAISRDLSSEGGILGRLEIVLLVWPSLSDLSRKQLLSRYLGNLKEREKSFREASDAAINPISAAFTERPLALISAEIRWVLQFAEKNGFSLLDRPGQPDLQAS